MSCAVDDEAIAWRKSVNEDGLQRRLSNAPNAIEVTVELRRLRDLPPLDIGSANDPYVTMRLGGQEKKQSRIHSGAGASVNLANETFKWIHSLDSDATLAFKILDKDLLTDDVFGKCAINILGMHGRTWEGWLQIYGTNAEPRGELEIRVQLNVDPCHFLTVPRSFVLLPATKRRNTLVGACSGMGASFDTYELRLRCVEEVFQDTWQANYDEEHAPMFANNIKGAAIRGTLSAEHSALYRNGVRPTWLRPEGKRMLTNWLGSGMDLFDMIGGGIRNKRRRVYSYALLDTGLYFSETGVQMSKDIVSKHAVHANGATRVRFSGTFRFVADPAHPDTPILVIDNDSGTYRPNAKHFPLLEEIFAINFPNLRVLPLCVVSPQPDETKRFIGPCEIENDKKVIRVYPGKWVWNFQRPTVACGG